MSVSGREIPCEVNMAGYSSRSDQLWYFAQQLLDEETKSVPFLQEEHGQRIRARYNQLVSNLSCLGDILAAMYEKEKLTLREFEQIQHLQSTPIRANEELLSIIARKPRDVYECFLSVIRHTNQLHLCQMLVSDDDTCEKTQNEDSWNHKDLFRRNFISLSEKLDTENGLISMLYTKNLLSLREREYISGIKNNIERNELLLGLLSKKSPKDFEIFLEALKESRQGHLARQLREPQGSRTDTLIGSTATSTSMRINHGLHSTDAQDDRVKSNPHRPSSKPVLPPKALHKSEQKLFAACTLAKPVPAPKPVTFPVSGNSTQKLAAQKTVTIVDFRRNKWMNFKGRMKGLESRLLTDIAIKVTYGSLFSLDKLGDTLKTCIHALLRASHQMNKEIFTRNFEEKVEFQQLRKCASQYSAASILNEVFRTQLNSAQQELKNERLQNKNERIQFEEQIHELKTDIQNAKAKCKRFEEQKLQDNAIIIETKDRLKKSECEKLYYQDHCLEMERNLERERSLEKERRMQMEKSLKKEKSLELVKASNFESTKPPNDTLEEELSEQRDRILHLQEKLDCERYQSQTLEEKLRTEIARLEELNRELESRGFTIDTPESRVIVNNYQFLVENINSQSLISYLHLENCITDEERDNLTQQPNEFFRNHALLYWMRTIPLSEYKGRKVFDCLRRNRQTFVANLFQTRGVLIKSTVLSRLEKERKSVSLFAKSSSKKMLALKENEMEKKKQEEKEKETMVIEKLNDTEGSIGDYGKITISEETNDYISIAPFCQQEAEGIALWFWCQTKHELSILQAKYSSGVLLENLINIFKEFFRDDFSSTRKLLVPTSITILDDFTKKENEFTSQPWTQNLIYEELHVREKYSAISGLAVLNQEVFISRHDIEVYNSTTFVFKRRITVEGLTDPGDIASCSVNNCLYTVDSTSRGKNNAVLRINPSNGSIIKTWAVPGVGSQLSIAHDTNVIVKTYSTAVELHEYTADGDLVRIINFGSGSDIQGICRAVKLPNGHFVVACCEDEHCKARVCLLSTTANLPSLGSVEEVKILATYWSYWVICGYYNIDPMYLSVNKAGSIMASLYSADETLLFTSDLDNPRIIASAENGMNFLHRTCFDEPTDQWYLADNHRIMVCRVRDSEVRRRRYDLISQ